MGIKFKNGFLLFCNGGLAATCCEKYIDPIDIPGWEDHGYMPEEWTHFPERARGYIGTMCPTNGCQAEMSGEEVPTLGKVFAYPEGIPDEHRPNIGGIIYQIFYLKGAYDSVSDAIAVVEAHYDALHEYAKRCVCEGNTDSYDNGLNNCWWDEAREIFDCTNGWGISGPQIGDVPWVVHGSVVTVENTWGIRFDLKLKRHGGYWETLVEGEGTWEGIMYPCDLIKIGGTPGDPHDHPYEEFGGGRIYTDPLYVPNDGCTEEIEAAFAAVPSTSVYAKMLRDLGEANA